MTVDNQTWNMINDRIKWLRKWVAVRNYDIAKVQTEYLYILYCTVKNIMETKYARITVVNINKRLLAPLKEEALLEKVFLPVEDAEVIPRFKNDDIISRLGITKEEWKISIHLI